MYRRMVFLRCNTDHHGIALWARRENRSGSLNHFASSRDARQVFQARACSSSTGSPIVFEGRGARLPDRVESRPHGNNLEIY